MHRSDKVPPFEASDLFSFLAHLHLSFPDNIDLGKGLVLLHQDAGTFQFFWNQDRFEPGLLVGGQLLEEGTGGHYVPGFAAPVFNEPEQGFFKLRAVNEAQEPVLLDGVDRDICFRHHIYSPGSNLTQGDFAEIFIGAQDFIANQLFIFYPDIPVIDDIEFIPGRSFPDYGLILINSCAFSTGRLSKKSRCFKTPKIR